MFIPPRFRAEDPNAIRELIRKHPFATVITQAEGKPFTNHLPLVLADTGELTLLGHMARANPQWRQLEESDVTAIFHGPQCYVSPRWYRDELNVPTWNYAVVHVTGRARTIDDAAGIEAILKASVDVFEGPSGWRYDLPADFRAQLVGAIVGFEIQVQKVEAKFKLSQNRSPEDRQGVIDGLQALGDPASLAMAEAIVRANQ